MYKRIRPNDQRNLTLEYLKEFARHNIKIISNFFSTISNYFLNLV